MWGHRSGEFYKERPVVVYEYQKGRDYEKPLEFYRNYKVLGIKKPICTKQTG